jgi:Uma2 family endonuclease
MIDAGILVEDDSVELIAGEIVSQMPIGPKHSAVVKRLNQTFSRLANDRWIVSVQDPIALDDFNEPEPDVALLRPRADFYEELLPGPADILLLVEVADSSLAFDREEKIPLYALAQVPEVWVVNLVQKSIDVYRHPEHGEYQQLDRQIAGGSVAIPGFSEVNLRVNDLAL